MADTLLAGETDDAASEAVYFAGLAVPSYVGDVDFACSAAHCAYEARPTRAELVGQSDLLREIFGNPFRPVSLDPAWLAWNDGTVRKLAQAIYDGRAFERLPILADALEEAGCANADILCHCRGPGLHVRGCWPVDLVLGKE